MLVFISIFDPKLNVYEHVVACYFGMPSIYNMLK